MFWGSGLWLSNSGPLSLIRLGAPMPPSLWQHAYGFMWWARKAETKANWLYTIFLQGRISQRSFVNLREPLEGLGKLLTLSPPENLSNPYCIEGFWA